MKLKAPAKINPVLRIGKPRADGMHRLASVMQAVTLFDELTVSFEPSNDDPRGVDLHVDGSESVPRDDSNLVVQAIRSLRAAVDGPDGIVTVNLVKKIPVSAGLGGGSSDAATAMAAVKKLLRLPIDTGLLRALSISLGSDIPFCLSGRTAVVRGIGESLTPLTATPTAWVLVTSGAELSTRDVYARFDEMFPEPADAGDLVRETERAANAFSTGLATDIAAVMRNDLEAPAISLMPELADTLDAVREAGAVAAQVSGSGPTVMGLCRTAAHAREVAAPLTVAGYTAWIVTGPVAGPL